MGAHTSPGKSTEMPFQQVLDALLDEKEAFHPRYLYRFSDLEESETRLMAEAWPKVSVQRRRAVMEDIEELGETNLTLSFEELSRFTVGDSDARVRELAVRVLSEYESDDLIQLFESLLLNDPDVEVRAVAATGLGKYVYLGEIEELPEKTLNQIVDRLIQIYSKNEATLIRRRALESLGYSSREEINPMIESAFYSGNEDWIITALFAMGRTANAKWNSHVMEMLENDSNEIRYEAARAAGELELHDATERLVELLNDSDSDIRMAAVWSLSQIGGEGVRDTLEELYDETEDEEEADFIDQALENLLFTEDMADFSLIEVPDEGDDEEDEDQDDFKDELEDEEP
jgi:HEAT repeat protein